MNLGAIMAAMSLAAQPRKFWIKREPRPATDDQMAAWRARRAQGTPAKRPGHRLARKSIRAGIRKRDL